ncbi:TetR/AcrR family transcriptional regulator [Actinomadura atramentaria]|uniref:TetR/AcrR family transcriptional regulator n=1 Tax=Actinomadura atramentaria TaxID=1990 RepID=UPI00037030A9|nr:TetR/AcrR family transcriptional regulator [Actinomadura atramentaria]
MTPRSTPAPESRRQDPDKTRRALLDAALDVFSEKGYAGARVQDIADRAGVNKQLISYHFGGKEGLYAALHERWLRREAELTGPDKSLEDLILAYLRHSLRDPRGVRLKAWKGLTECADDVPAEPPEDLTDLLRRRDAGEIAAEFDPACLMMMLYSLVMGPIILAPTARAIVGHCPGSPEFEERYGAQLRLLLRRLAETAP